MNLKAILTGIILSVGITSSAFAYPVKCADSAFWDDRLKDSSVERYISLDTDKPVRYFLTALDVDIHENTDKVTVIYNPERASHEDGVGILVFENDCARDQAILSPKIVVDSILSEMLGRGLIE